MDGLALLGHERTMVVGRSEELGTVLPRVPVLCWFLIGFALVLAPTALLTMSQG